ncbi:PQQ-dependent sugar dehydrogenase [Aquisalinus flavus]|uniref:Aldose dehydrogenase n=1 Tax=Aquisalinus flavus TaxID=1526572 RepID=A0A8J2Y6Y0_9PROT|nr:PQQ-dependent sugar dehydrogenase [Aquisalinus flavus]UNE48943.1 PQQ-dependent sugar dehydrogenase [Aquisalinus flavus]GGD16253.1 aldose dehydrogenase [Aquisalinus flavus]
MRFLTAISATALIAGLSLGSASAQSSVLIEDNIPAAPVNYELEVLAEGLESPYSVAFLPDEGGFDGDMLVVEKSGELRVFRDDELLPDPVEGTAPVHFNSQAGFLEVALHPDFEENSKIYLVYAHGDERANGTRLSMATWVPTETGGMLEDYEVLFTADPLKQGSAHYGGRLAFLPDDTMLLTIGDGYTQKDRAPKLDNHFGKIIRLNLDGTVPDDNPFVGQDDAKPEIWSFGHRNPQGLIYDPASDTVYEHEHGPKGGDEINIIEPGNHYGWPVITYGIDYSGAVISPFKEMDGMEQPVMHFVPSIAPSGFTLYRGDKFPEWDGDLFIGALAHEHVRRIDMGEDGSFGDQQELFTELGERIRDVRTGPDGHLYVLTDGANGKVIRVKPAR